MEQASRVVPPQCKHLRKGGGCVQAHLPQVLAVICDDGVAQHQLYELAQIVRRQGGFVGALQAQPEVVVQGYVQEQDVP